MTTASRYWRLIRLDTLGRCKTQEMPLAKEFFGQQFPQFLEQAEEQHGLIQQQLLNLIRTPTTDTNSQIKAELCLRCFLSSQIEQVCIQLETQFGAYYGFNRHDLCHLVLDDDGRLELDSYQPLAIQILQTFNPDRASLVTWTIRLVKHHPELNSFLLQCGLCLLSDWAILNDTTLKKLQRVLAKFYQRSAIEIHQAGILLESYHAVYRRDRLQRWPAGSRRQCQPPTLAQLQEMSDLVQQQTNRTPSPTKLLECLQSIAKLLRQYRIFVRGGKLPTKFTDNPEAEVERLTSLTASHLDEEDDQVKFLQCYRQQFIACLEQALDQAIRDRLQVIKPPKTEAFITALQLFHCQRLSMTKIAPRVGLKGQHDVTRLLKLKEFRADVRHWMLKSLRNCIQEQALTYVDPARLQRLDAQIEAALSEQIAAMIEDAQREAKTSKSYTSVSLFARHLCHYLDLRKNDE